MTESDEVVQASFEALQRWTAYSVLSKVLDETPDLHVYLAGGVIRDICLGRQAPPKDFDFFLGGPSTDQALSALQCYGSMQTGPFGSPRWYPLVNQDNIVISFQSSDSTTVSGVARILLMH